MLMTKKKNGMSSFLGEVVSLGVAPMAGAGIQMGMGSMAATVPGTPAAATLAAGQTAVGNMFAQFPTMGTIGGMKPLIDMTSGLGSMVKKAGKK